MGAPNGDPILLWAYLWKKDYSSNDELFLRIRMEVRPPHLQDVIKPVLLAIKKSQGNQKGDIVEVRALALDLEKNSYILPHELVFFLLLWL